FIGEYSATIAGSKGRKRSPRLSVPSSSGNTLQHRLLASQIAMSLFQSPLHRGILCNGYSAGGKALESAAFSPLFIGEYSATRLDRARRRDAGIFQSPLHRGILCNKRRSLADKLQLQQSFSPLFSGEYSATSAARWARSSSCSSLSVPSSSGNTLQRQRTREKQGTELA